MTEDVRMIDVVMHYSASNAMRDAKLGFARMTVKAITGVDHGETIHLAKHVIFYLVFSASQLNS